jgi:hypothetical protein
MNPIQRQKPESTIEKLTEQDIAWMKESMKQRIFWGKFALVVAIAMLVAAVFYHLDSGLIFFSLFAFLIRFLLNRSVGKITEALASGKKYVARFKCKTKWVHRKRSNSKFGTTRYYLKTVDDRDVELVGAFSGNGGLPLYDRIQENDVLVVYSVDDWISFWIDTRLEKSNSAK